MRECVANVLIKMNENNLDSISIPAISTGKFKFPRKICTILMSSVIKDMIDSDPDAYRDKKIIICNLDTKTTKVFKDYFFREFQNKSECDDSDTSSQN